MRVRTASSVPRWAVVALVAGLLLAACSDPEEPGTVPRTTPSPSSSSASPTPTTPEAQVEAAVRTYYAELERAGQTNDTSRLKRLVDKNCPCYNAVKVIEGHAARGERNTNTDFTLESVRVHDVTGRLAAAEVHYSVGAYRVVDEEGETVARIRAQRGHFDLSLAHTDGGWIVVNVFDLAA